MYLHHFGMTSTPFSITPDTTFFMNRAGYQDALNVLLFALRGGEGFVKVIGEVGTGKTLLCRKLLNTLNGEFVTCYIHNPYLEPKTLLFAVADELRISYTEDISQHALLKRLTKGLLDHHANGKRVVMCLDEVQAMPMETLEALRLLSNLETEKRKLLQVVMFGQPELDELLDQRSIRQLKQRVTFSYRMAQKPTTVTVKIPNAPYSHLDRLGNQSINLDRSSCWVSMVSLTALRMQRQLMVFCPLP